MQNVRIAEHFRDDLMLMKLNLVLRILKKGKKIDKTRYSAPHRPG